MVVKYAMLFDELIVDEPRISEVPASWTSTMRFGADMPVAYSCLLKYHCSPVMVNVSERNSDDACAWKYAVWHTNW